MACTLHSWTDTLTIYLVVFLCVSLGACVAVAAAELPRPRWWRNTVLACFTKFVRLFFGFLTACFLLRVLIIIITTTTATTPMMLFALYLSIYLSIYQSSQFSSVLFWPKFFWANLCLKIIGHRVFFFFFCCWPLVAVFFQVFSLRLLSFRRNDVVVVVVVVARWSFYGVGFLFLSLVRSQTWTWTCGGFLFWGRFGFSQTVSFVPISEVHYYYYFTCGGCSVCR